MADDIDIDIRIDIARQAVVAAGEVRGTHALSVLDCYLSGHATHAELVHASAACRARFRTFARQGRHSSCLALYSVFSVIDRIAANREPAPSDPLLARVLRFLFGWLWAKPPALPPYPATPYRTATTLDLDSRDRS